MGEVHDLVTEWVKNTGLLNTSDTTMPKLKMTIAGKSMTATLVRNSSAEALVAQLRQGDIVYEAHDYGDFEKVGDLGYDFPQNNTHITTTPGDIILYTGNNLCIYYGTNTWNFTLLGKIDGATSTNVRSFVNAGGGNVRVTLSLDDVTNGIHIPKAAANGAKAVYNIQGQQLSGHPEKSLYIENGRKIIK